MASTIKTDVIGSKTTDGSITIQNKVEFDDDVCVSGDTVLVGSLTVGTSFSLADASSVNISTPLLAGADHTATGLTAQMLAGGAISAFDLVCIHTTTGEVVEADASAYSTARVIGIAPAAISDTATGPITLTSATSGAGDATTVANGDMIYNLHPITLVLGFEK